MAIYDVNGNSIATPYDVNGNALIHVYDVDGNMLTGENQFKVCSYNVGGWYIGSGTNVPSAKDTIFYNLQNGIISDINADILCIEEYWSTFSQAGRTAESLLSQYYPYIETADGTAQYYGRAICSKYPISSYTKHYFSGETRYYDEAVINILGETVHVFVTHLHPSNITTRIAESVELFNYIQTQEYDKYIICGDFNSPLHDPMSEQNIAIYKQFLDEGCTIANDGEFGILNTACNSADWANEAFAIDNIIASQGFTFESVNTNLTKITDADVLATGKIDHVPLYAIISFET